MERRIEKEDCGVISPVIFEDEESLMKKWSDKICRNDGTMNIPDPTYIPSTLVPAYNSAADIGMESVRSTLVSLGCKETDKEVEKQNELKEYEEYAYINQKGKNRANLETELDKEKRKECTVLTHGFSNYGFSRAKAFSDGTIEYNVIAHGRIEEVQRWSIAGKEYARLLISDTTPSYIKREAEWTNVFEVLELKKDSFAEELLSRYFKPSDSRAYNPASIKDFRSRIYEEICSTKLEEVQSSVGWYKFGGKRVYYDGGNFPKKEHILGCLRRSCSKASVDVEEVLNSICKELEAYDIGNRLSFLIGYGMVTWFSDICSLKWNKHPGIMLLGREEVCRRYAEACLKMYTRIEGSDIVELAEVDKRTLTEYVDVLKDDAFVFNGNDLSKSGVKLAKAIVAGRSIANHKVNAPIVVLQNIPHNEMIYDDYVTIDLNGFKVSETFCLKMQELKSILISIFEADTYVDSVETKETIVSYEDAAKVVFRIIKQHLFSAGLSMTILDRFWAKLELGMMLKRYFCGDDRDSLVYMLKQRLEQVIFCGKVPISGEVEIGVSCDPKRSFIVRGGFVYIPAKYLEEVVLSLLDFHTSDFRRVRDALIVKGLLDTYDTEKNYIKRITVSKDERIYAYKLAKSLFTILERYGL